MEKIHGGKLVYSQESIDQLEQVMLLPEQKETEYLGETDDKDVSSAKARDIAIEIVSDYLDGQM